MQQRIEMILWTLCVSSKPRHQVCPHRLTVSWWWCYVTELAHSFCSVLVSVSDPFNCIFLPTTLHFLNLFFWSYFCLTGFQPYMSLLMKVSLSPDIILCGWLGLKHQLNHKVLLGCRRATGNACEKDRTSPILSCMRCCCSKSQCRQQLAQTSDTMADRTELSDSKMASGIDLY